MSIKIPRSLLALAIGGFGIGLTEFVIMGLLPEVADAMQVTIAQAGYFIAAYAFGVVVGAPVLALAGRALPPKKILIILMYIFTFFNGLSALAPNSTALLILRFLSGLPHGAFFGVGAVVASRIAGPEKSASAFAVMLGGLTICNVVGVPLATYIGHITSWRVSFGMVSVVGIFTIIAISLYVPDLEAKPKGKISDEFVIFENPILWYVIAIASIGFGGFFAWFSYITPILTHVTKFSIDVIPYLLSLAGLGMTFGNWIGGKMGDALPPARAAKYLMISMAALLVANAFLSAYPLAMYFLIFLTGANAMAMGAPIQVMLIQSSKESPLLGSSIGQGAFNTGNTLGAFLGGMPIAMGYGLNSSLWVGVGLVLMGLVIILKLQHLQRKRI